MPTVCWLRATEQGVVQVAEANPTELTRRTILFQRVWGIVQAGVPVARLRPLWMTQLGRRSRKCKHMAQMPMNWCALSSHQTR